MSDLLAAFRDPGSAFSATGGKRFLKEVLREGVYQHPTHPWPEPLSVTPDYLQRVVDNTNAALAAGVDVWVPDGHTWESSKNKGFARKAVIGKTAEGKTAAFVELDIEDAGILDSIGKTVTKVSAFLANRPTGTGKSYGERIIHVALTPEPVATDQENFVSMSAEISGTKDKVDIPVLLSVSVTPKKVETTMKRTDVITRALSVAGITHDGDLTEEVAGTLFGALVTALETEKAKPAPKVEALLSVDSKQPLFTKARTAKGKADAAALLAAEKSGKINADMKKQLSALLGVENGYALSAEGVASPVDVGAAVEALIDAIPERSVVPVGASTQPAPSRPDNTGKDDMTADMAKELAANILKAGGFTK